MRQRRVAVAKRVAASLRNAEREIDSAVASTAGVLICAVEGRADANVPLVVGQDALDALGEAVNSLLRCRRQVAEAHQGFEVAGGQMGLEPQAWGDQFPKPPIGKTQESLRVVA
jgi:hypothetical protein